MSLNPHYIDMRTVAASDIPSLDERGMLDLLPRFGEGQLLPTSINETIHDGHSIRGFFHEFAFLANGWPAIVPYEGLSYPSVKHAFTASSLPTERRAKFTSVDTTFWNEPPGDDAWIAKRIELMEQLVQAKFEHNPDLRRRLIETHPKYLEDRNKHGDKCHGNPLGKILMRVRDRLLHAHLAGAAPADGFEGAGLPLRKKISIPGDLASLRVELPLPDLLRIDDANRLTDFLQMLMTTKDTFGYGNDSPQVPPGFMEAGFRPPNDEMWNLPGLDRLNVLAPRGLEGRLTTFYYHSSHNYNQHPQSRDGTSLSGKALAGNILCKDVRVLVCMISDNGLGFSIPIACAAQPGCTSVGWGDKNRGQGGGLTAALAACDYAVVVSNREAAIIPGASLRARQALLNAPPSTLDDDGPRIEVRSFRLEEAVPGVFFAGYLYEPSGQATRDMVDETIDKAACAVLQHYGAKKLLDTHKLPY